jgi:Cell wall synthesis protein CwsA
MSTSTEVERLTPGARLARGLKYTTAGPLHLLLGVLGVAVGSARSVIGLAVHRCGQAKAAADDLAVAEVLAPAAARRGRPLLIVGGIVALLALGGATFSIVRRSMQPEPSALPPSVDVAPQP